MSSIISNGAVLHGQVIELNRFHDGVSFCCFGVDVNRRLQITFGDFVAILPSVRT